MKKARWNISQLFWTNLGVPPEAEKVVRENIIISTPNSKQRRYKLVCSTEQLLLSSKARIRHLKTEMSKFKIKTPYQNSPHFK